MSCTKSSNNIQKEVPALKKSLAKSNQQQPLAIQTLPFNSTMHSQAACCSQLDFLRRKKSSHWVCGNKLSRRQRRQVIQGMKLAGLPRTELVRRDLLAPYAPVKTMRISYEGNHQRDFKVRLSPFSTT